MKETEVTELVNRHTEALIGGRDDSRELLAAHAGPQEKVIGELLDVAGRVKSALRPIAPRAAFVGELKHKLMREARAEVERRTGARQNWILLAAGLGGIVYAIGVLAVGIRSATWLFGVIALILGWKKRQPAVRVVQP
ncbi:MAG: hypothetical protein FJ030_11345 [Chloroflexi bacterium]|nr:hypothetical protein [Chloroflexota bacterium]